jgi:hypothetical protein
MMNKRLIVATGVALTALGILALSCNLALFLPGLGPWRFWPVIVIGTGAILILPPLLVRNKPVLGGLFILGVPLLATGSILLFTSVFDVWNAWAWLWPLEVLALGVGLSLAAAYMRVIWLLIVGAVVASYGVFLQFLTFTGLWRIGSMLLKVEPLWWMVKLLVPASLILIGLAVLVGSMAVQLPRRASIAGKTSNAVARG